MSYPVNFAFTEFSEVQHSPVPLPGPLGTGRGVFSPKCKHLFVERTSMIAHIYPSVLQALAGRGYAGCLEGCFQGYRGGAMQDLGYELPRILIPRTRVNKEKARKNRASGSNPNPSCSITVACCPVNGYRCSRLCCRVSVCFCQTLM